MAADEPGMTRVRRGVNSVTLYAEWLRLELAAAVTRYRPRTGRASRRVLLLVDQFPPAVNGGVYRPLSFAQHAAASGWEVTVVASGAPQSVGPVGRELRDRLPADVVVHQLAIGASPSSTKLTPQLDGGIWRAFALVRQILALDLPDHAVVLCSGPPFHVFVAGWFLQRLTGAQLVLDYRDEWTECPFDFVRSGRLDRWWETRCLQASDLIMYTTESMRRHAVAEWGAGIASRTMVTPNGVDLNSLFAPAGTPPVRIADRPRQRISFLGSMAAHNDPGDFLRVLARVVDRRPDLLNRLEFCWIGWRSEAVQRELEAFPYPDLMRLMPPVPQPDACAWMQQSHALLLLSGENLQRYRPGKLYDYLASHTPILLYASPGECTAVIEALRAGIVVALDDDASLERALDAVVHGGTSARPSRELDAWIAEHDRSAIARRMFVRFDELTTGPAASLPAVRRNHQPQAS